MPYLLLVIGLLIGFYALYRFFLRANIEQIKALFLTAIIATLCLALFYLAITGRLAAALGMIVALVPFVIGFLQKKSPPKQSEPPITRAEALKILNLKEDANPKEIIAAYKHLMKKVHPDQEGSEWMAQKLNQAKDFLLKD